jgi:hypothetical protein
VETKEGYNGLVPQRVKITGEDGEPIHDATVSYSSPDNSHFSEDRKCSGLFDVIYRGDGEDAFPETIALNVGSFLEEPSSSAEIQGNWMVEFSLDKSLTDVKPKTVDKREISIEGMKFHIDYMNIYPTVIDVKLRADKGNIYRFTSFKNLYLEDERGNKYRYTGGTIPGDETILN